jgi:stearoyl-CoA desaturase (delta-9 desaturase)
MKANHLSQHKLNWTNVLFFSILPIVAIVGTSWLCIFKTVGWPSWTLAGIYMILTGLAITAGYHRLFAHKAYQAVWPLRLLLLLFAAGAFQGSALEWCSDHRKHHRYTDTEQDPYSIKKGFWYAHIGWIFYLESHRSGFDNVQDLESDKLIQWQHKYYMAIAIFMGFVLPMAIAALWGEPIAGLIIAGALRMTLNHHFTFAINSVSHMFGNRPYSDEQSARDNWFTALVTYGEGFHNFHHQFPLDYRNGIRFFDYDPTKWFIKSLSWFKLTYNLKQVSAHRIIRYHVQTQERQLMNKLARASELQLKQLQQRINPILENIYQALKRMETLEKEYMATLKEIYEKRHAIKDTYRDLVKSYKRQFKSAKQNLRTYLQDWQQVISNYHWSEASVD